MSLIYSITSTISRTIEDMISKSFLFTLIFKIFEFIENEWVNSYFKSLYPSENFLSIFKKSKILKEEIFSPLIVLVTFTLFLLLATEPVSRDLQFTILIAFISFFIGAIVLTRFVLNNSENNQIPLFDTKDVYSIGFCLTLIGIVFLFISIASVGGLPILKSSLRYSLKPIFSPLRAGSQPLSIDRTPSPKPRVQPSPPKPRVQPSPPRPGVQPSPTGPRVQPSHLSLGYSRHHLGPGYSHHT